MTLLLMLLSQLVHAETDTQLWMSTNVRKNVVQDWRVEYTQHLRFTDNISQVESIMPEFELRYKPIKPLSVKIGYRYIHERTKNDDFEPAHRYHMQLSTGKKFGPVKVGYRLRYQEKHEEDEFDYTNRLRNKVSFSVDTDTAVHPVIFAETFSDLKAIPVDSSKIRLGTGLEINLPKKMSLSLDYLYQRDFLRNDRVEHIARINYQVKVPKKKPSDEPARTLESSPQY